MIDFLGVGPERTGTSTLWRILQHHPEISFPVRPWHVSYPNWESEKNLKGIYWYDWKNFNPEDRELYESHWDDTGIVRGEISGTYYNFPDRIFSVYPNTKIIITWRNPVDRFVSHLALLRDQLFVRKFSPYIIEHIVDPHNEFTDTSQYIKNFLNEYDEDSFIESVEDYFLRGKENRFIDRILPIGLDSTLAYWQKMSKNLLIVKSEDLYNDQQNVINTVTDFLGVCAMDLPKSLHYNKKPKITVSDQTYQKILMYYSIQTD